MTRSERQEAEAMAGKSSERQEAEAMAEKRSVICLLCCEVFATFQMTHQLTVKTMSGNKDHTHTLPA